MHGCCPESFKVPVTGHFFYALFAETLAGAAFHSGTAFENNKAERPVRINTGRRKTTASIYSS